MVVEELLQFFIDKIDTNLLEGVELEYLKPCYVQDPDKVDFLHRGINESCIAHVNKVSEESSINVFND